MDYKNYFNGKKVTLMGLGLLGRGVGDARFLAECGADLIVTDLKSSTELGPSLKELEQFSNITFHLGGHKLEDFAGRDMIIKAAGVPLDSPFIIEAKKNAIPVRMSADLFVELSGAAVVGITGTRGKSTVSHLIMHILKTEYDKGLNSPEGRVGRTGLKPVLGGNIRGVSTLAQLNDVTPETVAVLELDSWQLQGFGEIKKSPHVAVFTTFMPDHMNYYKNDLELYFADKANIFVNQTESDFLILGEQVAPFIKEYGYQPRIKAHTTVAGEKDIPLTWQLKLPGLHNRYNAGLAAEAARVLGVEEGVIKEALESFEGVPGRLQLIRELRGIKIYNDTTSTVPQATLAALHALGDSSKKNIILIMGGADKGLDMHELLSELLSYCKKVLLLAGTGTERIKKDLPEAVVYSDFAQAVHEAVVAAAEGDVVLLSPAFASFGMFKNEYDRGEQFNALVTNAV